jgi:hypothetical protein
MTGEGQMKERVFKDGQNWSTVSKVIRKTPVTATDQNASFGSQFLP